MKLIEKALLMGLALGMIFSMLGFAGKCNNIEDKVLRLHILANSDSEEDQNLKLSVRNKILESSGDIFSGAKSKAEAQKIANDNLENLRNIALEEIHRQGYNYDVKIELTNMYFNTRHYEKVTFPAGRYDAVRIIIGNGKGHNWWCVMFPSMCLPSASEEQELSKILDEDEMDIVEGSEKYEVKFKCVEAFEYMKNSLYNVQNEIESKYNIAY